MEIVYYGNLGWIVHWLLHSFTYWSKFEHIYTLVMLKFFTLSRIIIFTSWFNWGISKAPNVFANCISFLLEDTSFGMWYFKPFLKLKFMWIITKIWDYYFKKVANYISSKPLLNSSKFFYIFYMLISCLRIIPISLFRSHQTFLRNLIPLLSMRVELQDLFYPQILGSLVI